MWNRISPRTLSVRALIVLCLPAAIVAPPAHSASISADPSEYPRSVDLFVRGSDGVALHRIPALTVTPKGVLIAVADARVEEGDDLPNNIDLVMRRSFDLGRTWTPSEVLVDFPGTEGAGDSSLLTDRDTGRVFLFYTYGPEGIGAATSQPGLDGPTLQLQLIHSDDEGATWSEALPLNPQVKDPAWDAVWSSPGQGFQSPSGRLYFPLTRNPIASIRTSFTAMTMARPGKSPPRLGAIPTSRWAFFWRMEA